MSGKTCSEFGGLPPSLAVRIDRVCNQFEDAWAGSTPPRIEDFLAGWQGPERAALLRELVGLEHHYRRCRGEDFVAAKYQARFPELDPDWLEFLSRRTVAGQPRLPSRSADEGAGRRTVAVFAGPARPASLEIQSLLRQRLRVIVVLAFGGYLLFFVLRFFRLKFSVEDIWYYTVPDTVYLAVLLVLVVIIWRKRPHSLVKLRIFEGVLFGVMVVVYSWQIYVSLFVLDPWFPLYAQQGPAEIAILSRSVSLYWLGLIVIYGTFIPNTGRRCALVGGLMAATPLIFSAFGGFSHPDVPPGTVVQFLGEMLIWMAGAVTVAVFGSHKIMVLRKEAQEARKLGQYQLKRRLGAGGMGEVYLAEHVLLRRPCAVKIILPERAGDPATLARFEREVQATAALTHPNTVQVFDYGHAEDGTFYYAMEYLPGATLEDVVRGGGPLPPARALHFLRQVCGALAEAHKIGLIHRDLKPGNIIACERGGVPDMAKLLDFGIVGTAGPTTDGAASDGRSVVGTPAYMSPEQASARPGLDARSDVYSLGAVAYFLLTGRPPFVRGTTKLILAAHASEVPTRPDWLCREVPEDVSAVVMRCLEKDPARRFQDVADLEGALAACKCAGRWTVGQAAEANRPKANAGAPAGASPTSMERMAGFDM